MNWVRLGDMERNVSFQESSVLCRARNSPAGLREGKLIHESMRRVPLPYWVCWELEMCKITSQSGELNEELDPG